MKWVLRGGYFSQRGWSHGKWRVKPNCEGNFVMLRWVPFNGLKRRQMWWEGQKVVNSRWIFWWKWIGQLGTERHIERVDPLTSFNAQQERKKERMDGGMGAQPHINTLPLKSHEILQLLSIAFFVLVSPKVSSYFSFNILILWINYIFIEIFVTLGIVS